MPIIVAQSTRTAELRLGLLAPDDRRTDRPEGERHPLFGLVDHETRSCHGDDHGVAHPDLGVALPAAAVGTVISTISSPGSIAVRFTPVMNSRTGMVRTPAADASVTVASSAASTGNASPAGEQVPRLPASVPALRICGDPTVREASASAGENVANGSLRSSV